MLALQATVWFHENSLADSPMKLANNMEIVARAKQELAKATAAYDDQRREADYHERYQSSLYGDMYDYC